MNKNNRNISLLSDEEMNKVKGGMGPLGILGLVMLLHDWGDGYNWDSGSMSEEEYGDWVEGISGAPYDWGDW